MNTFHMISFHLKVWGNLWQESWDDPELALGNAGFSKEKNVRVIDYTADANVFGPFTDPYLINKNERNPHLLNLTKEMNFRQRDTDQTVVIPIGHFHIQGEPIFCQNSSYKG